MLHLIPHKHDADADKYVDKWWVNLYLSQSTIGWLIVLMPLPASAFQQGDAQVLVQPHAAGPRPLRPALRRLRRPHPRPPRPRAQAQVGQAHQAEQGRERSTVAQCNSYIQKFKFRVYRVAHMVAEHCLLTSNSKFCHCITKRNFQFDVSKRLSATKWATLYRLGSRNTKLCAHALS